MLQRGMQSMCHAGNIHAITRQGDVITNVEVAATAALLERSPGPAIKLNNAQVFKRLYEQVGLGWVYGFATIKPLRAVADR